MYVLYKVLACFLSTGPNTHGRESKREKRKKEKKDLLSDRIGSWTEQHRERWGDGFTPTNTAQQPAASYVGHQKIPTCRESHGGLPGSENSQGWPAQRTAIGQQRAARVEANNGMLLDIISERAAARPTSEQRLQPP